MGFSTVTQDLTLDLILLAAILVLGGLLTLALVGRWDFPRTAALAFPLGSGVLTWLLFLASWAGLPVEGPTILLVYGLACLGCLLYLRRSRRQRAEMAGGNAPAPVEHGNAARLLTVALVGIAVLWLGWNLVLSVTMSYSVWDSIAIWSVKGYGISREGSIFAARVWGGHGLAYPLHVPLLISLFDLAGGDVLPGSKMIFPLYLASLLMGVYGFGRRIGLRAEVAILSGLCVTSIPVLFTESTTGYANAPLTVYLVLGALALLEASFGTPERNLLIGGFLLGLASWTRVEGVLYAAVILLGGFVGLSTAVRPRLKWAWAIVPFLVIVTPWLVFYRTYAAGSSQAAGSFRAALEAILGGQFRLGSLRIVLTEVARSLADVRSWGWALILAAALGIIGFRRARRPGRAAFVAGLAMSSGAVLVTILLFYVGSFAVGGLQDWLERSLARELLPSPTLLLVGALSLLRPPIPFGREPAVEAAPMANPERQDSA